MKYQVYKQPAPNTIKIEPTEGCNLACWFCAIQTIRNNGASRETQTHGKASGPFKFMTPETAERISMEVARVGWTPRFEIAGRGEPTANLNLVKIVAALRKHNPRSYILLTTNGSGLARNLKRIQELFEAGVSTIALDDYKHATWVPKIVEAIETGMFDFPLLRYPQQTEANPYHRTPPGKHRFVLLRDIIEGGGVRNLHNQGGNSGKKTLVMEPCARPFRDMTFRHDGFVALCCDDWQGAYRIGNILEHDILALWHGKPLDAARRALLHGDRRFKPCAGCDVQTKRNGLLPDKRGQDKGKVGPYDDEAKAITRTSGSGPIQTPKI